MKTPNFFIIGAPKCGTSSLAHWLSQHPNVFMSPAKEPHYFSDDFPLKIDKWRDISAYRALFEKAGPSQSAVGEASVWYLRSREAVNRIESELPGARYIVMLRNPVEMAPSLHWQLLFSGDETIESFERAWRLQSDRENGESIPVNSRCDQVVKYRLACSLGEQLSRLYDTVEQERVLVVFLEDMHKNHLKEWARILNFLDVPYWEGLDFSVKNRAKHWRCTWVRQLMELYAKVIKRFNVSPLGWGVFRGLQRLAVKEADRQPLTDDLRFELIQTFRSDIDLLEKLTGRDLSHWKNCTNRG